MKPTKKWEPIYRFGGNPADAQLPAKLGTKSPYNVKRPKKRAR